jgi:hypothetical protein
MRNLHVMRSLVMLAILGGCREPTSTPAPAAGPSTMATVVPTADDAARAEARKRSPIKGDERVVLFPAYAARSADGERWEVELHAWIFEPEEDDLVRKTILQKLARPELDPDERARFQKRIAAFLVDNERDKVLSVSVAGHIVDLPASEEDGHALANVTLPASVAARADNGILEMEIVVRDGDDRRFAAPLVLVEPEGLSIISDIDDTVKVSEVLDRQRLLRRTFLEEFEAVPGMAPLYRKWLGGPVHVHFVSSSPWQLYEPLAELVSRAGFPPSTFSLKRIRPRNVLETLDTLHGDPLESKPPAIRALMDRFPKRTFILVGDSGEKDPEVYGVIARERPQQVERIVIRDVTREERTAPRYGAAFAGVPAETWSLFTDATTFN